MTSRTGRESVEVVLDAPEIAKPSRVGTLWFSRTRTDLPASFAYDEGWLATEASFQLDPRLELFGGEQHPPSGARTFGVLEDAAPA